MIPLRSGRRLRRLQASSSAAGTAMPPPSAVPRPDDDPDAERHVRFDERGAETERLPRLVEATRLYRTRRACPATIQHRPKHGPGAAQFSNYQAAHLQPL
jgi:hypothetical protein